MKMAIGVSSEAAEKNNSSNLPITLCLMPDAYILKLTPEQIEAFDYHQAEEKSVYIRYLLIREQREEIIMKYYFYLELIETKLKQLKKAAGTKESK
jgi:hypothetical protein